MGALDRNGSAHTVTVVGVRGGSGKTMLATNLGAIFAQRRGETSVLADLNLEFPAAALSLGIRPPVTLAEIVQASPDIDDDEFDSMLAKHPSGLRLLSGSLEAGQSERVTDSGVGAVLARLGRLYDHVVMDCRPSFRDFYLDIWESSDQILVACPPDVVSIGLTRHLVDAMDAIGVDPYNLMVVLNHVVPTKRLRAVDIDRQMGARQFEIPYAGPDIHYDEDQGKVFALQHPRDAASRALRALADELVEDWEANDRKALSPAAGPLTPALTT
ncbi:MAG TPA: AAA family ATPase [Candidatus Solibacter sp.]|jgi:pilus assembly protein CpaE|nr:AAA family ATPase [Candidatus Solibacter sp.]